MDNLALRAAQQQAFRPKNPCIMDSIDPSVVLDGASGDTFLFGNKSDPSLPLESLNIHSEDSIDICESPSLKLLDENEKLKVSSADRFIVRLRIPETVKKVKVVSIFGKTGDGKSFTLNKTFFDGLEIFSTSAEQSSCTFGVWAAFDPKLNVICIDTEGLLGISKKEDQRTRLLLKVLAISDIVIYRTKSERLQSDMFTFLGGASKAYKEHFQAALQQVWEKAELDTPPPSALGPSVIIFHETFHTNTLHASASVSESPEDILRNTFADMHLHIDAFSSLKYIGVRTRDSHTSFKELKNAIQLELEDTKVRSARHPKIVYLTLKGLNEKFSSELKNAPPQLHLEQYFTCQEKCQSCDVRCTLSMGHKDDREAHYSPGRCKFQHQYQNCVYLCKKCNNNGQRVVVKPSYQSITQNSWSSFINYVWAGYVIECKNCGEIYRSRQHWYGNKNPEDSAVIVEIVHMWPGVEYFFQERNNLVASQNSAQRVLDGVNMISDAVISVGSQPTKAVTAWVTDKIAPAYWRPNNEIMVNADQRTPSLVGCTYLSASRFLYISTDDTRSMSPERSGSPQEQALAPKMSVPASPIAGTPAREAESPLALLLAVAQSQSSRAADDDLTSLSWLHERDVLKGINLVNPSPSNSVHTTPVKAYGSGSTQLLSDQSPTSDFVDDSSISATESSGSSLNSPTPYQNGQQQNGVQRNKHPHNVPYDPMVHTSSKPPYSFSCLIFMAIEDSEQKALPVKEIYAWILEHFPYFRNAPTGWKNSVRHNLSLNKCFQKVEKAPNLGKGSLWTVDPQFRPNLLQALTRSPFHPCSTLDPTAYFNNNRPPSGDKNSCRLPNPDLFPYLSRTLAAGDGKHQVKSEASDDSLDAVDAATVMLSLKNGPRYRHRKEKVAFQVITNSPSEDHTYSASESLNVPPDEAFESDEEKYSKSGACRKIEFEDEEERKIQEGAETLLNLAGISTRKRHNSQNLDYSHKRKKSNGQFMIPEATYEKPTQFRPRLLRAKRKDKIPHNNNNNTAQVEDEWVKHRRELEEGQKR